MTDLSVRFREGVVPTRGGNLIGRPAKKASPRDAQRVAPLPVTALCRRRRRADREEVALSKGERARHMASVNDGAAQSYGAVLVSSAA